MFESSTTWKRVERGEPVDTDKQLADDGFPTIVWDISTNVRWVDARGFQHNDIEHLDYCIWMRDLPEATALCAMAIKTNRGYGKIERVGREAWELSEHPDSKVCWIGARIIQDRD